MRTSGPVSTRCSGFENPLGAAWSTSIAVQLARSAYRRLSVSVSCWLSGSLVARWAAAAVPATSERLASIAGGSVIVGWLAGPGRELEVFRHSLTHRVIRRAAASCRLRIPSKVRAMIDGSIALAAARDLILRLSTDRARMLLSAAILGFAPFTPTPLMVVACLLWGAALAAAPGSRRAGRTRAGGNTDIAFAFLALCISLSAATSVARGASLPSFVLWAAYSCAFAVSSSVRPSREGLKFLAVAFVIGACAVAAIGVMQFLVGGETPQSWIDTKMFEEVKTRVYSVFDNPNMLAEYLGFALPVCLALAFSDHSPAVRSMGVVGGGLLSVCLVLTLSRGGWLAALIGLVFVAYAVDRRLVWTMLAIMAMTAPFLPQTVRMRAISTFTLADSSSRYRLTIWTSALRMVRDYWASGVGLGPGAFSYVYPAYEIAGTPAAHTHNVYLQTLVESGIPALFALIWYFASFLRETTPMLGPSPSPRGRSEKSERLIAAAFAGGIAGQMVHGFMDNIWYSPKDAFVFWVLSGLALACARHMALDGRGDSEARAGEV